MADLSAANFSTTDSSNNAAAPNGWKPGTMLPSDVEPTMQATTGAIKRFWERANAQITTTGAAGAYVYTPTNLAYPSSIVQGEVFGFVAHQASVGNDTFTIAGSTTLGPYNLYVVTTSGIRQIKANEIVQNQICVVQYSSAVGGMLVYAAASLSSFSPAFTGTPTAPTAAPGTNTTQIATTGFATQLAFQAALPAQGGATAGSAVLTDGAGNATWADPMITAAAGGTSDAITATFAPAITLRDKQKCFVVCSAANTTTTPTFAPNGLTAHTITMAGGTPLAVGSIAGAGFVALLEYNLANLRWELLNPSGPAIFPDYANLRIYAGSQQAASITGFLGAAAPSGIAGAFTRDDTDTTSGAVFTASSAPVPSPAAPALAQTAGGAIGVTTYYVKVTYVTAAGETLASAESNFNVGANNLLVVTSPSAQTGATGYNVYVSTTAGTETKQNAAAINIGTNWTEPTSGVTAGIGQPASSTAGSVLTVSAVTNGTLAAYYSVSRADAGNAIGTISALISGTGTTGTYLLNASVTLASMSMTADNGGTVIVASNGKRWKRAFNGLSYNVKWWGVRGDGVTDDTAAIQSAIGVFSSGNVILYFPAGTYVVTTGITVAANGVKLVGAGKVDTVISFSPTVAATCIAFSRGASVIYDCEIRDLSLAGGGTSKKTGIKCSDISDFVLERVEIRSWTGSTSVGLQTLGRELSSFTNLDIFADVPIQISKNPNSTISCNEFSFRNCYLVPQDATQPVILADDNVYFSGLTFDGFQSWVGGKYGFYYNNTTSTAASQKVIFRNIWKEQTANSTGYVFYIANSGGGNISGLTFDNCHGDTLCGGYYLRGVLYAEWRDCLYTSTTKEALNVDASVINMAFNNFHANGGSTATITGQTLRGSFLKSDSTSPFPDVAWYQSSGASNRAQMGPLEITTTTLGLKINAATAANAAEITDGTTDFAVLLNGGASLYTISNNALTLGTNNTSRWQVQPGGTFAPYTDNVVALGDPTHRATTLYAVSGTVNTSDAREKTNYQDISPSLMRAVLKVPLIAFQWIDAIERKGPDGARWHYGVTAQSVRDAIASEGLDPLRCAFVCYDEWNDIFEDVYEQVTNDDGEQVSVKTGQVMRTKAGNRWGVRMDQFLIVRQAAFEAKVLGQL